MSRPKIKIELDTSDRIIEAISMLLLILMLGYPLYYYAELPDIIPVHFNAQGVAAGFGQKSMIWYLSIMGWLVYWSLFFTNKYPHLFNYPKRITTENAERQYRLATKCLRVTNLWAVTAFCYVSHRSIQVALEHQARLSEYFLPAVGISFLGIWGVYLYLALRKAPQKH